MYLKTFSLVAILFATNLHAQSSHWQPRSPFVIDQLHRNRDSLILLHQIFLNAASSFDFSTTMDSCNQYIQTKDDAMAAIEAKGMEHNPVLGAEWDRLFEQKYFAFQDVISTYSVNNASSFAEKIQHQLERLNMIEQNIKYEIRKPTIQNDTIIRYYQIRAEVDKLWVYNFPANGLENMVRVVFVAQLRNIAINTAKKLVFAPAVKEECGTVSFSFRIH